MSFRHIVSVVFLLILFVMTQTTTASAGWITGAMEYHPGMCSDGNINILTDEITGYFAADAASPKVGNVYYVSVYVANPSATACFDSLVNVEVSLPKGTVPAVSATNPIICTYKDTNGNVSNSGSNACPTTAVAGTYGWGLGWARLPAASGTSPASWEVRMPVISTVPLNGIANDEKLIGYVSMTAGAGSGTSMPYTYVKVFDNAPSIGYPSPSNTNVTTTTLRTNGYLYNNYKDGIVQFELGESPNTGYPDKSTPITLQNGAANNYYPGLYADWSGFVSTSGHWRMCFTPTGGATVCGAEQLYTLTAPPAGTQYTLTTSSGAGGTTSAGGLYPAGNTASITATPGTGYIFGGWTLDGTPITDKTNPYQLVMNANHDLKADFTASQSTSYALLVNSMPAAGGSVTSAPVGTSFAAGDSVSLTAVPATGYTFSGWTVNGASAGTTNPLSVVMSANKTVQANFTVIPAATYTLTVTPATGGTVTPTPSGTSFTAGASVSLAAAATTGFTFSGWTVDGASGGATNPLSITMSANHTVLANFTAIPATTYTLTVTPATGGTVTPTPSGTSFAAGTNVSLTAAPANGFTFFGWTVDGVSAGSTNPLAITMSANKTVQASFAPVLATYTLTVTQATGGTVTNTPSGASFSAGASVSLTATPANSYTFSGWTVDGVSAGVANPLVVTMGANKTVQAKFNAALVPLTDTTGPTLNISSLSDGAVTGNATLNVAGTVSDASGVASLTVNNVAVTVTSGSFSYPLTLAAGANIITTVATDTPGNKTTDTRTITLSTTAPSLNVSTPADNSKTAQPVATVSGTTSANTTVAVKVNNGSPQNAAITGSNFSATVNLTVGINTIDITATNTTAQTSNAKRTVTYDNGAPSLSVTNPAQDISTTLSSITISGTVSDSLTTATIKIAADGQNYAPAIAQNGGFSQLIPLPTDKTYAVIVTATDEAGNSVNVTRNIIKSTQLTQPSISDALKVLLDVAGTTPLNAADKLRFDVAPLDNSGVPHGDGIIDDADVILILRRSIGIGSW